MAKVSETLDEKWRGIIEGFTGRRLLVVGDVILDRYLWGDVDRTSPEAPVPIVRLSDETTVLGGASNVIANLAALGARPSLVGLVGRDAEGDNVRGHLAELGVGSGGLVVDRRRPTTLKTRVVSLGQQLLRLDREEGDSISADAARRIMVRFEKALRSAELVILSDYGKGVLNQRICVEIIARTRRARKRVIVDPKGMDYRKYRGAWAVKPNQREAEAASGVKIDSTAALGRAARRLQKELRTEGLVITRGGQGVSVFERRRKPVHVSAQVRAVYDVTGAGDSFTAAMSLATAAGATLADAARIGNAAGSIVVGKLGCATATPEELLQALQPGQPFKGKGQKKSDAGAATIVEVYGGRVKNMPLPGELTTGAKVERITRRAKKKR